MNESHLTWLRDSFVIAKSSSTEEFGAIYHVIVKTAIEKQAAAACTCSTFSRVAMHDHNICGVFLQPTVHLLDQLEEQMKWRCHMILPVVIADTILEDSWIVSSLTDIEYPILISMCLI